MTYQRKLNTESSFDQSRLDLQGVPTQCTCYRNPHWGTLLQESTVDTIHQVSTLHKSKVSNYFDLFWFRSPRNTLKYIFFGLLVYFNVVQPRKSCLWILSWGVHPLLSPECVHKLALSVVLNQVSFGKTWNRFGRCCCTKYRKNCEFCTGATLIVRKLWLSRI